MSIFDLLPPFATAGTAGKSGAMPTRRSGGDAPASPEAAELVVVPASGVAASPVKTTLSPSTRAEIPTSFPPAASPERLRERTPIGEGGMGVVASAFDAVLLRRFAQKVMRHPATEDPSSTLRFVEEAQITAQLDHPNIVPVHDLALGAEDGKLFFTMKLVDGETLRSVFSRLHQSPLSGPVLEQALGMFLKACDAVSFAHSRGVLHRDLKPDNVMVGSHGQVYVMDWGVALLLGTTRASADAPPPSVSVVPPPTAEEQGTLIGTVAYMAPEQAHGLVSEQGIPTDVYGLGSILYHLLTGEAPHHAATYSEMLRHARRGAVSEPSSRAAWPQIPPGLCRITMKALAPFPMDRYASVDELRRDVERFLRGGGWFETRTCAAGEVILTEGDEAGTAFIVAEGSCEVYRMEAGERRVLRTLGEGEIFGEVGLLTRRPRVASVMALEPTQLLVITPAALERELARSEWMRILVEALAVRFREADQGAGSATR